MSDTTERRAKRKAARTPVRVGPHALEARRPRHGAADGAAKTKGKARAAAARAAPLAPRDMGAAAEQR